MNVRVVMLTMALTAMCGLAVGNAWPRRSQARYECCCQRVNPDCGATCFVCRNERYGCDCDTCSCYPEELVGPVMSKQQQHDVQRQQDLLEFLLRGGFGGRRFKKNNGLFDDDRMDDAGLDWQRS